MDIGGFNQSEAQTSLHSRFALHNKNQHQMFTFVHSLLVLTKSYKKSHILTKMCS